ncbi:MAG: transcriptional regulator [Hespellia sp.]|nr:transcriptional regulator [Hespellia sp.]
MSDLVKIGKSIVLLRNEQGLTQEEVAFRSNLSVSRLQSIEYGCQNTTVDTLIRIAKVLKVDSRVFGLFSRSDSEILSEIRQLPPFPKRRGGALQICENIVMLRKAEHLTQKQLALLSNMSVVCLRDIEHGCANITTNKLLCIAEAFDLSLVKLSALTMPEEELMDMIYKARDRAGIRL